MKQCLFWLVGLMSLLSMSSCDDKILYDGEANFLPEEYSAKYDAETDTDTDVDWVSTTLLIYGPKELVFSEVEKSDWRIITKERLALSGKAPLELYQNDPILLRNYNSELLHVASSYGDIDCVLANYVVTYNYLGQDVILFPKGGMRLSVRIDETAKYEEPYFFQSGHVVFMLSINFIPVKIHKIPFYVIEEDGANKGELNVDNL